jgi:hypothetical protein
VELEPHRRHQLGGDRGGRRSTAALVLDVAQALLGERCRRWRWSAPRPRC